MKNKSRGNSRIDPLLKAKARAESFYDQLARLLGRHLPIKYGPRIASIIHNSLDDRRLWRHYPVHIMVHSIEANCAYYRRHRDESVTEDRIRQIVNHYHGFKDPYIDYVLTELKSINLFTVALARQQFPMQRKPDLHALNRCLILFVDGNPLKEIESTFNSLYGISMRDWVYLCIATYALIMNSRPPVFRVRQLTEAMVTGLPKHAIEPFLKLVSLTPQEVAAQYREARSKTPIHLHTLIASVFFNHPVIAYEDGSFLVVHPYLMVHHSLDGLYRLCDSLNSDLFRRELGDSFERYVKGLLGEVAETGHIFAEDVIQRASAGRACDYAIEFADCILLVECKAVRYSSLLATDNAIAKDNSTAKVAIAFAQLLETATRIRNGALNHLFSAIDKPIYAVVTTFGELPFVNSPGYFERYIAPRMPGFNGDSALWYAPLTKVPQVFSIELLEDFVVTLKNGSQTASFLFEDKFTKDSDSYSDWEPYLSNYELEERHLPFLYRNIEILFGDIGVKPRGRK